MFFDDSKEEKDQKINFRRISDQAALIQNIDKLKVGPYNQTISFSETYTDPKPGQSVYVSGLKTINSDGKEASGITINKLYNFKRFIEEYNKLGPASLSLLNPYIEIYKIYENGDERILPFNNFFPKAAIDAITSGRSDRGYQANIQNVKISSQGKDTATAFIYTVQMSFIFDSVQTLFNDNSKYIELFNPPKKYKFKRGDGDPKYYQIKLKFGWNIDQKLSLQENLNLKTLGSFASVSSSEIFLNYIKHNISINEDGSIALTVEYVGSLEVEARNPNKFSILTDDNFEKLKHITEQINNIEESLSDNGLKYEIKNDDNGEFESIKIIDSDGKEVTKPPPSKAELERLHREKKSLESNNLNNLKEGIMKNILKQFGSDLQDGWNYAGSFPVLNIEETSYNKRNKLVESTGLGPLEVGRLSEQIIKLENEEETVKFSTVSKDFDLLQKNLDIKNYLNKLEFPETSLTGNQLGGRITGFGPDKKYYQIPFFTFRNLLKSLETLYGDNKESDFIILGTEIFISKFKTGELLDPKILSNNPEYKIAIDNGLNLGKGNLAIIENKLHQINILDIPIALSTFRYWFNKNINSQNITQMSLMTFLNLCVNELLVLCVNPVNSDYVPRQNITFKVSIDKIMIDRDNTLLEKIKNNQRQYSNIDIESGESLVEQRVSLKNSVKKNVIIFYAAPKHNTRVSNFKRDLEDGIPHFFYGQNKGIVNKINFREEAIPFFKEANIQNQVDRKPWRPGIFLRSKYNVTIEMMGTVNFRVGSMIYVSPSFPGVLNTAEPLDFGIGGYFVIISINTEIQSGRYITTLEANWVSTGTGEYTDLSHLPFKVVTLPKPLAEIEAEKGHMLAEQSRMRSEEIERRSLGIGTVTGQKGP